MDRTASDAIVRTATSLCGIGLAALTATSVAAADRTGSATQAKPVWPTRALAIPVDGVPASALRDSFRDGRPGHRHEAIDIPAPQGTKVFAVDDGKVAKLFKSVRGGLTVYQFDPQGRVVYYYAHLDRYAEGLRDGMTLRRCDLIGYVGSTGNASVDAPHLHFAVLLLGAERRWWQGTALDPLPALEAPCG